MMLLLKFFKSKRNSAFIAILISIAINSRAYGQLSPNQALELKDCISANMVKLLFDNESNSRSTKIFLIKVVVKNGSNFDKIEVSDNLDLAFKNSFLKTINLDTLKKTIKNLAIKQQTLLIPVQYLYGKEETYLTENVKPNTISYYTFFNGIELVGDCYWLKPIITYRN